MERWCRAPPAVPCRFCRKHAMRVLRTMKDRYGNGAWCRYGFVDAFNPLTNWYDHDVDRNRHGNHDGDGGKCALRIRLGYFHEEPGSATRHGARRICSLTPARNCRIETRNLERGSDEIRSDDGSVEFDQGQPLRRQDQRQVTMMDANYFWRWKIRRAPKRLNLSLRWIDRFAHGCVGGKQGPCVESSREISALWISRRAL